MQLKNVWIDNVPNKIDISTFITFESAIESISYYWCLQSVPCSVWQGQEYLDDVTKPNKCQVSKQDLQSDICEVFRELNCVRGDAIDHDLCSCVVGLNSLHTLLDGAHRDWNPQFIAKICMK